MRWVYAQLAVLLWYLTWTAYTMRTWDALMLFGVFAGLATWAGIRRFKTARAAPKALAPPLHSPILPQRAPQDDRGDD